MCIAIALSLMVLAFVSGLLFATALWFPRIFDRNKRRWTEEGYANGLAKAGVDSDVSFSKGVAYAQAQKVFGLEEARAAADVAKNPGEARAIVNFVCNNLGYAYKVDEGVRDRSEYWGRLAKQATDTISSLEAQIANCRETIDNAELHFETCIEERSKLLDLAELVPPPEPSPEPSGAAQPTS